MNSRLNAWPTVRFPNSTKCSHQNFDSRFSQSRFPSPLVLLALLVFSSLLLPSLRGFFTLPCFGGFETIRNYSVEGISGKIIDDGLVHDACSRCSSKRRKENGQRKRVKFWMRMITRENSKKNPKGCSLPSSSLSHPILFLYISFCRSKSIAVERKNFYANCPKWTGNFLSLI